MYILVVDSEATIIKDMEGVEAVEEEAVGEVGENQCPLNPHTRCLLAIYQMALYKEI
jgi:hypothetical protein